MPLELSTGVRESSASGARLEVGSRGVSDSKVGQYTGVDVVDPTSEETVAAATRLDTSLHPESRLPTRTGRYVLLEFLGAGAMGVVNRAYDPELQREVAVKRLKRQTIDSAAAKSLLREARAMATLSHPNVLPIYDVGIEDAFFAMEYVDGVNLAEWLNTEPRSRNDILRVFLNAGRGLHAAHLQGLVHRDFKPQNVMVGNDGRVRVMDFGLVRRCAAPKGSDNVSASPAAAAKASDNVSASPAAAADERASLHGYILGTPKYMAPESKRGQEGTARSDQYSFCRSLYLALNPEETPEGMTEASVVHPARRTTRRPPKLRMPRELGNAISRGLSPLPEDRWPDMDALLQALQPRKSRRRVLGVVGASAGLTALAAWAAIEPQDPCAEISARVDRAWSEQDRADASQAFGSLEASYAQQSWASTEARLDVLSLSWTQARLALCHSRVASDSKQNQQHALCLDRQLELTAALVNEFTNASAGVVENAVDAVNQLPSPESCADPSPLRALVDPPPLFVASSVRALNEDLAQARANILSAQWEDAFEALTKNAVTAAQLGYPPAVARTQLLLGDVAVRLAKYDAAEAAFRTALLQASASGDIQAQATALTKQCMVTGAVRRKLSEGLAMCARAEALLESLGNPAEPLASLQNTRAGILSQSGNHAEALAEFNAGLQTAEALPPGHPLRWKITGNIGLSYLQMGNVAKGREALQAALTQLESLRGSEHPLRVPILLNLARLAKSENEATEHRALLEEAFTVAVAAFGETNSATVVARAQLGFMFLDAGEPEAALEHMRIAAKYQPIVDPSGKRAGASYTSEIAGLLNTLERYDEAIQYADKAIEQWGPAPRAVTRGLRQKLHALRALDAPIDLETVEVGLEQLNSSSKVRPEQHAEFEFLAAQIFEERADDRARARALVKSALLRIEASKAEHVELGDAMRTWLEEHPLARRTAN